MRRLLGRLLRIPAGQLVYGGIMSKIWLSLAVLILYGCAGIFGQQGKSIVEVGNKEQIRECQLLKIFTAPGGDFIFGPPIMLDFKIEAKEKARKMGATHILYRAELNGNGIKETNVVYAYKCPEGYNAFQNKEGEY